MKVAPSPLAEKTGTGSIGTVIPAEQKYWIEQRQQVYLKRIAESFDFDPKSGGRCLYHALAGILAGSDYGVRFVVQAGSAHWRYRNCPIGMDSFGYQWQAEKALQALQQDQLPELHVWLLTEAPQEEILVDFSVSTLAEACPDPWEVEGYEHPLWLPLEEPVQLDCLYEAHPIAAQVASRLMENSLRLLSGCQEWRNPL